jgi:hypothetical protein
MKGIVYRMAVAIKDIGERAGCNGIVTFGKSMREWALIHTKI